MSGFTAINREPQYNPHPAWLSQQDETEIENPLIDGFPDSDVETDHPYYDDDDDGLPKTNIKVQNCQLDNFDPRDWDKTVSEINSIASEELHETRPNRWIGYPSTWRKYTDKDEKVWYTLEKARMDDLAVHLYNCHVLRHNARIKIEERKKNGKGKAKATPKKKGKASLKETDIPPSGQGGEIEDDDEEGSDENGDIWKPAKTWTAWPAYERGYERLGDGGLMADLARGRVAKKKLPGDNMREEIAAEVFRAAKERFYRRQTKRKRPEEEAVEDDGDAMDIDEPEASGSRGRAKKKPSKKERSPSPELLLRADDEVNFGKLRPFLTDIMFKIDGTLTSLHISRLATMRLKVYGPVATAKDNKNDDTKAEADTKAGDKTPKRSPASKDSTLTETTTPVEVTKSIETPVPLPKQTPVPPPKQTPVPLPKQTPVPLPKTPVPLPKTPVPLPKTPVTLPKRTPVPLPGETEEQMRVRVARLQKKALPESYWDSHDRPIPGGSKKKSAARSRAGSAKGTPQTESRPVTPGGTDTGPTPKKTPQKRSKSRASSVGSISAYGGTPPPLTLKKHQVKFAGKLKLRNWRHVLRAAASAGFEPEVIARAAQRCATLFQEDISLRTMHKVPLMNSPRAGWETVTYKPGNLAAGREESELESEEDDEEEEEEELKEEDGEGKMEVEGEEEMEVDGEEEEEDEEEAEDYVDRTYGGELVDGYLRPLSFPDVADESFDKDEDEDSDETASEAEDLDQDADKGVVKAVAKTVAKKEVANKGPVNKGAVNKTPTAKAPATKTPATKAAAKKAPVIKAPAKKGPVKTTVAVAGFVQAANMVKKNAGNDDFNLVYSSD
ncbi:hypothetical protein V8F06_002475 [Rhypophila decipiens]